MGAHPTAIHVVGCGLVTSIGATAPVATAALRGGIRRMVVDDEGTTTIAPVGTLIGEEPQARARAMLRAAITEALRGPRPQAVLRLGVWIAGPEALDCGTMMKQALAGLDAFGVTRVTPIAGHGSAPLSALPQIVHALNRQDVDLALLVAFDVRTDPASLAAALPTERTIGPKRHWGHVPGDAAAAVLLCGGRVLEQTGRAPQLALVSSGVGHEPVLPNDPTPCVATGLTEAIQAALAGMPKDTKIDTTITDINGERGRSDEWGFTIPRIGDSLKAPDAFWIPSASWGDCGSANGLLALALAAAIVSETGSSDQRILIWTSGDRHERAAVIVQGCGADWSSRRDTIRDAELPAWAKALDRDLIEEIHEECSYRYQQRTDLAGAPVGEERPKSWAPLERSEEQLDTLVLGLGGIGVRAADVAVRALDPGTPGTLYVAIRMRAEGGDLAGAVELAATFAPVSPPLAQAARDAFKHARNPQAVPTNAIPILLAGSAQLVHLAVELAAAAGTPLAPDVRDRVSNDLSNAPEISLASWGAVGLAMVFGRSKALDRWMAAPEPVLRREAAIACLLTTAGEARPFILRTMGQDHALLLPAALVCDRANARALCELAAGLATPDGLLALALVGDPAAVPSLLRALGGPHASAAATALELLLGDAPMEKGATPDEDPSAPRRQIYRRSLGSEAWDAVARAVLTRHPPQLRLRGGQPGAASATIRMLQMPHLDGEVRRWLALELAVRHDVRPVPDASALLRVQRDHWGSIASGPPQQPPGSWDIPHFGV